MSISLSNDEKGAAMAHYDTATAEYEKNDSETEILDEVWQGTTSDKHDMDTLGRVQELRVRICSSIQSLSLNSIC